MSQTAVDAVIAALRSVLREAERRTDTFAWDPRVVNRWIGALPGFWPWRWHHPKVRGEYGSVSREDLIGHVRATLVYLEANRDALIAPRGWTKPYSKKREQAKQAAIDVAFDEAKYSNRAVTRSKRLLQ